MQVAAIILAGGNSSRMGEDKGLLELNGSPMIGHVINTLKDIADDILIVSNNEAYQQFGLPVYSDIIPNKGPIGGIYTGLVKSNTEVNIVISCDSPFMTTSFINKLLAHSCAQEVTISSYNGRVHPTIGIYNQSITPTLKQQIDNNEFKLMSTIEKVRHQIIPFSSTDEAIDPIIFSNINTQQELLKYQK